jgi:hypothetical protein
MSWREFSYLMNGLSAESPLGRIVTIRAEDDPEVLKEFTPEMRKIRADYRKKMANEKPQEEVEAAIESFKQAFLKMQ